MAEFVNPFAVFEECTEVLPDFSWESLGFHDEEIGIGGDTVEDDLHEAFGGIGWDGLVVFSAVLFEGLVCGTFAVVSADEGLHFLEESGPGFVVAWGIAVEAVEVFHTVFSGVV